MSNPLLLDAFNTPHQLPPFEQLSTDRFKEGIEAGLAEAKEEVKAILEDSSEPSFANTIEKMEQVAKKLGRNSSILFNLNSAETSDELQKITQEVSPKLSAFNSEMKQNPALFTKVKSIYKEKENLGIDAEQTRLLEETYEDFVRRGANLSDEKKKRFKEISIELSKLSLKFSENVLAETNAFELVLEKEEDLSGLPDDVVARAKTLAKQKGKPDSWIFTLQQPSYVPFMEYADNRMLREKLYRAFMTKCFKGDERDNTPIILQTVSLRAELAKLLGYHSYASYVLEQRMAEKPDKVENFLRELLQKSLAKAKEEYEEVKHFMEESGVFHDLERWDWAYFSDKLKRKKYNLSNEMVKPYFKLENVINGVFHTAEKLYEIAFVKNDSLPKYHPDVATYEVLDHEKEVTALFYADFFPRNGKRPGAWMTSFRGQSIKEGKREIPQISIVCNFTPSSEGNPSLLKFNEVLTLFHEFGHALHGMLANTRYESLSGTNVYWDFVELPSQIMENWCYEKECLNLFARHYETDELIPADLVKRIKDASTYHEAYATVRQLSFGLLDMKWHNISLDQAQAISDVSQYEQEAFAPTEFFPKVDGTNMSVQFSHIFAGGYGAGYYSYKWAEVLDADAFSVFKKKGVFDRQTAKSFKENILSKGGTRHPMELYKNFRGGEPKIDALLERAGLS